MKSILTWLIALVICAGSAAFADQAPRIDKDELKAKLGQKDLVILDVRQGRDWDTSEFKIKDAIRVENSDLSIAKKYPKENTFVLYCAWPNEGTSASLAQQLIDQGYSKAYALKGGWQEWSRAKYPVAEK